MPFSHRHWLLNLNKTNSQIMSHDESLAIDELRKTIRWLIGGVIGLLSGAAGVGGWVATQEGRISSLAEADKISITDRSEMRGELRAHSSIINAIQKDSAVQSRDLQYIREAVTEIKESMKKP
jgi:hypothetical protein